MNTDDVVSLLQRAKERVAAGWVNHPPTMLIYEDCAVTAVARVEGTQPGSSTMALCALYSTVGDECQKVSIHNDHLTSTADALDWFDRAIRFAKDQVM